MSDSVLSTLPKLAVIATLSVGLNYLIRRLLKSKPEHHHHRRMKRTISSYRPEGSRTESFNDILNDEQLRS
jgi:hypothetical protein